MAAPVCARFSPNFHRIVQKFGSARLLFSIGRHPMCTSTPGDNHDVSPQHDQSQGASDPAPLFTDSRVQEILHRITGFDLDQVFKVRSTPNYKAPDYKLMTDQQLREAQEEALQMSAVRLQMPPVLRERDNSQHEVISEDREIADWGDCKMVFTDITYGVPHHKRMVVVREVDGILRTANPEERDRILHIYNPQSGKMHKTPKIFTAANFERVLAEGKYEYLLDWACLQFSPDDPEYIRVTQRSYEHIDRAGKYHSLRNTRHFGGMTFYLTRHHRIDGLLVDMIQRQMLNDAYDTVCLYHLVHPDCESATQTRQQNLTDQAHVIKLYATTDAKDGSRVELALQAYQENEQSQSMAT